MIRLLWTAPVILTAFPPLLHATETAYFFTGSLSFSSPVFNELAPVGEFHGRFIYDPEAMATDPVPGCDCMGYRQRRTRGFVATFGDLTVQADDYIVEIDNDFPQGGGVSDIFTVIFTSNANPPLSKPLLVNGVPQPAGLFSFSLGEFGGALFDAPTLPSSLELGNFLYGVSILSDLSSSVVNVTATIVPFIDTLQPVLLLAGDYDYDGDVDGSDFLLWQSEFGSNDLAPDGDGDGLVDSADLELWKHRFGSGDNASNFSETMATPEPGSALLVLFGVLWARILSGSRARIFSQISMPPSARRRICRGFTIVELLVVIAILAVLTALSLPGVQRAREAVRRSACQHNLRQVGLALLNYEAVHRKFPPGAQHTALFGVSWWVSIYPFVQGAPALQGLDVTGPFAGWPLLNAANGKLVDRLLVPSLLCPSSALDPLLPVGNFQLMMPSYVGVSGATSHGGFPETRVNRCCDPRNNGEISGGGLLVPNLAIRFANMEDGASNLLAAGEASDVAYDGSGNAFRIDGGHRMGWITGTSVRGAPPEYTTPFAAWNLTTIRYVPNTTDYALPGVQTDHGPNNPLVSAHPHGVNAAFAAGSVHFVASDVDIAVLKRLATRDDASAEP